MVRVLYVAAVIAREEDAEGNLQQFRIVLLLVVRIDFINRIYQVECSTVHQLDKLVLTILQMILSTALSY